MHVEGLSCGFEVNQDFFKGLSNIERVIVYGHSFYEIDWPYMSEIVKQIGKNKPWIISYHEKMI